ncbi:MAG: peroxiredoxin [Saprospiraceae bacterium]|nr:peroxiredoxin [Saprospiraceae bacterium]
MEVLIGEKAPLFTLRDQDKEKVALDSFRGRQVVLVFFPLAFSSVCTKELCHLRDELAQYEDLDAQILGVSVDSLYALRAFRETQGYNFPLLSDFNKETSRSYGALHEDFGLEMKGVSKRSVFVIDKEGIIRHAEILDNPGEMPNFAQVKQTLRQLS